MKAAKICAAAAVLLAMIGPVRGAAAGTKDTTIFVANEYHVTAYPADARGDVAPIALTTDMAGPSGIGRDASGRIYVTNGGTNTVTIYAAGANGNVPPLAVIGGSNTKLTNPHALALDAGGKIYVLNSALNGRSSITVYPPLGTNTGILNEAPVAAIAGSKTGLAVPAGIALDSQGNIYVANEEPIISRKFYDYGRITVYPAGSNGNIAPATTISGLKTGLALPVGIAVDSGGNIYVGNVYTTNTNRFSSITVYSAGSKGDVAPIAVVAGSNTGLGYPEGIALDSRGNLYTDGYIEGVGNTVDVYPAGSNGNVFPAATIAGLDTGLQFTGGIALDSGGNIYVANSGGGPNDDGGVTVYAAGSSGNAVPTATITSSFTGLEGPSGIALDSSRNIYVANQFGNYGNVAAGSIDIYSAGSYATGTPIATIAGDSTGLSYPFGIALDSADNIFVLNRDNAITVYPAGSAGDAAPNATISVDRSGKSYPIAIAVSPHGDLYVANQGIVNCYRRSCSQPGPDSVSVYRARSDGNARPSAVISGPDTGLASPSAIAVHGGSIYVTNEGPRETKCGRGFCFSYLPGPGSVTVYPPGSNGNVKPIATISGANTGLGLPYGITLDSSGDIYLLNAGGVGVAGSKAFGGGCAICASDGRTATRKGGAVGGTQIFEFGPFATRRVEPILIFAPGSNGDVAPISAIGGRFTGLYGPAAIAVGPAGP